jgi:hypothetical protein
VPPGCRIREFHRSAVQRSVSDRANGGSHARRVVVIVAPSAGAPPDVLAGLAKELTGAGPLGPPERDEVRERSSR